MFAFGVGVHLAERGIKVDDVAVYLWVQRFTPLLSPTPRGSLAALGG